MGDRSYRSLGTGQIQADPSLCSGLAMPSVPFCAFCAVQVEDLSAQAQANAAQHLAGVERQDLSQAFASDISIVC